MNDQSRRLYNWGNGNLRRGFFTLNGPCMSSDKTIVEAVY